VRAFRRESDGSLSARFTLEERNVLASLADQVAGLLAVRGSLPGDPVLARLLPDAYRGDADAASEFRRFTEDSLAARKIQNAITVTESLERATALDGAGQTEVALDAPTVQSWLRCLTDIRLTVAARLGIESDEDEGADDDESLMLRDVYDWLGFVQGSLIEALER
jgi:Domain of unknown function (DUF2017).